MRFLSSSLLILGIILYIPKIANAANDTNTTLPFASAEYQENNNEMTLGEYKGVSKLQTELINSELAEISAQIKSLNPELYNQVQGKTPMEQLYAYRSWLAQQAFNWYKERLISDLKLKSANTSRHILMQETKNKNRVFQNNAELDNYIAENCVGDAYMCQFWLDRGKYDTTECFTKDGFREEEICEYALNFEEYTLQFTNEDIWLIRGNAAENTFETYHIILSRGDQHYNLSMYYTVGNLADFIEYENRTIRVHAKLETLTGRDRRNFIKQYNQAITNGDINTILPALTVGGVGASGIGVFNQ